MTIMTTTTIAADITSGTTVDPGWNEIAVAKIAYAELLIKVLTLPKQTVRDEVNTKASLPDAQARITAKNRIRAELRTLLGEDIFA